MNANEPRGWRWVSVACCALVLSVQASLGGLRAQTSRKTERVLCDPESPTSPCAYMDCECVDGSIEITFDGDRQSVLEYATFEEGLRLDVVVVLDHSIAGAQGWSYGVAHDPDSLDVLSATFEGTEALLLQDVGFTVASAEDIWTCLRPFPDLCRRATVGPEDLREGGGWISAIVLSFMKPVTLPVGRTTVGRAEYALLRDVGEDGTRIAVTHRLAKKDSPITDMSVTFDGHAYQWTRAVDGLVRWAGPPELERLLCDPENPANGCPGPDCPCLPDGIEITFDGDRQHALQYESEDFLPGMPFEAIVVMDVQSEGILGWNFGVAHDVGFVRVTGLTSQGTDAGALRHQGFEHIAFEDVSLCVADSCGPEAPPDAFVPRAGWICATVLSFADATELPLGRSTLMRAAYVVERDVGPEGTFLRFSDRLRAGTNPLLALELIKELPPRHRWTRVIDGWIRRAGGGAAIAPFVRGDVGFRKPGAEQPADGAVNITDVIRILTALFVDAELALDCEKAADADDSGSLVLTDAVYLARVLFLGDPSPELPPPGGEPGEDPTPDSLGCGRYP